MAVTQFHPLKVTSCLLNSNGLKHEEETHTNPTDTLSPFLCPCELRTCNADDGPLCGVQHISRGRLGALDAVVSRQVPGQRVTRGRGETH